MAYIETISPVQAGGELKNIYERLVKSRGKIAEVHKIQSLTTNESADYSEHIETLKSAGFDDRAILDTVQVIAYFNFVNRIVLGLGVTSAEEEIKGYKY